MKTLDLAAASFTVQHINLSAFSSVTFTYAGLKPGRKETVTVQEPVSLISRKDGRWTVRARNRANTRTINLRCGTFRLVTYKGEVVKGRLA